MTPLVVRDAESVVRGTRLEQLKVRIADPTTPLEERLAIGRELDVMLAAGAVATAEDLREFRALCRISEALCQRRHPA